VRPCFYLRKDAEISLRNLCSAGSATFSFASYSGVQTILRSQTVSSALPSGATSSMREPDRPVISLVPRWNVT
jgi:hypothetical protein